jgi:hypothetical protein
MCRFRETQTLRPAQRASQATLCPLSARLGGWTFGGTESVEEHRNSRALVLIVSTNPQFGVDLFDKRSNYPQSQSFTIGRIKTLWQTGPVIGNCQRVALFRIEFQTDRYPAGTVLDCVRDQFAGMKPRGMAVAAGKLISIPSTATTRSGRPQDSIMEKSRQIS